MFSNLTYADIAVEFGARVVDWARLDEYVTDAIIRDAYHKLGEFWSFWDNDPRSTANGRLSTIQAFVRSYIEVVENLPFHTPSGEEAPIAQVWTMWGTTLRLLEVG
jgi:hypothetical protein